MLTKTQQVRIDEMHIAAQEHIAALRAYRESRYKDRALGAKERQLKGKVKIAFKAIINEWLQTNSITAHIRSELRIKGNYPEYTHYQIQLGATSIFNGKGGLDKKSRWLNKISVDLRGPHGKARLRSHKARTDPDFLEPTAAEFTLLIQYIHAALNNERPG